MTVTDQDRFDNLVSLYFDHALDAEGQAELNGLLESDPDLAARFLKLGRIHGGLRELESSGAAPTARPRRPVLAVAAAVLGAAAAVLLAVIIAGHPSDPAAPTAQPRPQALLVVGEVPLVVGDELLQNRLMALGFDVVPVDDDQVDAAYADGKKLIVITESVWSEKIGAAFAGSDVPILNCEPSLNQSLLLSRRAPRENEFLAKTGRYRLRVWDAEHPLSAGLGGTVKVYVSRGTISWGLPYDSAIRIASCVDNDEHVAIFAYEAGTVVPGGTLQARRVSFFIADVLQDVTLLTPDGWSLFDAAVRWSTEAP